MQVWEIFGCISVCVHVDACMCAHACAYAYMDAEVVSIQMSDCFMLPCKGREHLDVNAVFIPVQETLRCVPV